MAEAAILKKNVKSPYLCNRLTDFDEIWHADPDWPPYRGHIVKFVNLKKTNIHVEKLSSLDMVLEAKSHV